MAGTDIVTLFHAPKTRSSTVLFMLEEVGAPYDVHLLDMEQGGLQASEFLAINPLGKVPAIEHKGQVVTETVAILLYLADEFPANGLAPSIGNALRGPYLRWMTMYAAAWEPAIVDRAMKREPGHRAMSPYGSFDALFEMLTAHLAKAPYLLGDRYSAADVLWGSALRWMTLFKLLPEMTVTASYMNRVTTRPALARAQAKDQQFISKLGG
jgi:glutathione S-transferase